MSRHIRVALAGIGCCASSFVQTVELARLNDEVQPGVMYSEIGGYQLRDVEFVTSFEVDHKKVGLDLAAAILVPPTVANVHIHVEPKSVTVEVGPLLDGLDGNLNRVIEPHPDSKTVSVEHVVRRLRETSADVLICFLPTGAHDAIQAYAQASAHASVAFVNATPEPVANDPELVQLFEQQGVALLGDDLRSHFGATALHTALIEMLQSRAIEVINTYQLNVGGNMDFLNLSDPERSRSKQKSKRRALFNAGIDASTVSAGPNGYVQYLGDTKTCFLRIEATTILHTPIVLDIRMQVEDSPNAAGVIANAVRIAKVAGDHHMAGVIDDVCPFLFKSPRYGATESQGLRMFRSFVERVATSNEGV